MGPALRRLVGMFVRRRGMAVAEAGNAHGD